MNKTKKKKNVLIIATKNENLIYSYHLCICALIEGSNTSYFIFTGSVCFVSFWEKQITYYQKVGFRRKKSCQEESRFINGKEVQVEMEMMVQTEISKGYTKERDGYRDRNRRRSCNN